MQSLRALADPRRLPGVDVLRGVAVIAVVLFHFGWLPYGYVGVDLFFVISGFLVGRPLVRSAAEGRAPQIGKFLTSRAFKIWPSYYVFLLAGTLLATILYAQSRPDQIISPHEAPTYGLFIQNYRATKHWSFDHVWSLCVEEHFYVLLPVSTALLGRVLGFQMRTMRRLAVLGIATGVAGKLVGYAVGFETHSATHNRIDALSWGLLLACAHEGASPTLARMERSRATPIIGAGIVASAIALHSAGFERFAKIGFHAALPLGLVLVLAWMRGRNGPRVIRFVAYYSYNLYLWHAMLVFAVQDRFGKGPLGLAVFLFGTMALAMLATVLVEEPALKLRDRLLRTKAHGAQRNLAVSHQTRPVEPIE